jgi:hypothetical protein
MYKLYIYNLLNFSMQAITASSTKKADLILGEIQTQIKNKGITVDVKANSASNVRPLSCSLSLYKYLYLVCRIVQTISVIFILVMELL